ncbi:MAG: undecaprenyldiphospho-muramoylpentapeptide beta-N-acetylglucosaminyltransferase [Clostridiaceae bacterium]|nr:undecaprenyldiphospho-muramoylpentapeptide beta-N-acetylglucosaminyltransferase [Clostridiaceae bacterium]
MKVLISGGGTAGHINPGIAIAKYIKSKNPDCEILFVGTKRGLETTLVPRENFELKTIKVKGFKRKLSKDTLVSVKELFQGIHEARVIIKEFKPNLVIGTGGYVCGPVVFNAARMKIPTLIHEQNAFPGVTNKLLSRFVDKVAISFKESEKFFKDKKKIVFTGNPIRGEMLNIDRKAAKEKLGIEKDKSLVVIFGGSRGAETINNTVSELISQHRDEDKFHLLFATGEAQYDNIKSKLGSINSKYIKVVPYIYNMGDVMAAADLVVGRAGAITLSELTALGVPSILIPSPYVTANHQEYNARALETQEAAIVILEKNLNHKILYDRINTLLKDANTLEKMAQNSKNMGITNASEKIYDIIDELIKTNRK